MNALASTWPWSLPPGPAFLVSFIPLALLLVGLGVLLAIVVGNAWDGPIQRVSTSSASSAAGGRSGAAVPSTGGGRLLVGRMPRADDIWLVAWLRAGRQGLRTTLYTAARTAGWLQLDSKAETLTVLVDVEPADPVQKQLHHVLAAKPVLDRKALITAIDDAAARLETAIARQAEEAGLVRPIDRRLGLLLVGLGGGLIAVVAGIVRIAVRGQLSPDAVFPRNLVMVLFALLLVSAIGTWVATGRHRQARAYLAWLDDVTLLLRMSVRQGSERRADDVVLVSALGGHTALGVTGAALGLSMLSMPAAAHASGSGSSGSSSCSSSSSSCSSSGSSCGSSCGGGGGCS